MKYDVFDIANWFLNKAPMNQRKLQKLCYYSQAWNYALYEKPLFEGEFEAWVHGPVNRTIWNKLKAFGYSDIPSGVFKNNSKNVSVETSSFLERIWATYGEFTGYQLELLSHTERPWIEARGGLSSVEPSTNKIIPSTMKEYYIGLINPSSEGVGE